MELRERQREAIYGGEFGPGILKCWDENFSGPDATGTRIVGGQSTLVVAATGFGKTVLFAGVADILLRANAGRVMLLTHRDRLLWQARDTFEAFGYQCDVEMSKYKADGSGMFSREIILMTVQSGRSGKNEKRAEKFRPEEFGLVIVDEAHHAVSSEFLLCINHFRQNPNCKILGVTATPDRHDEKALRKVFGSVAYAYGLQRAIQDGWLCPIEAQFHELENFDISQIPSRGGDLQQEKLENELLKHVAAVAQEISKVPEGDLTLTFCIGVKQAEALTDALNAIRPSSAACIHAKTRDERRTEIYQSFVPGGMIQHLVNVGVATEGYDNAYIQHVFMNRPTESRSLFEQMAGRGSRTWPGIDLSCDAEDRRERIALSMKPANNLHDFVGISGSLKLITTADILGGNDSINSTVIQRIRKSGKPANVAEVMREVSREFEEQERVEEAAKYQQGKAVYRVHRIDPFNLFQISDVRKSQVDGCARLSPKQYDALVRAGCDPATLSSTQGKQILGALADRRNSGLATPKMVNLLRKAGVPEPEKISFEKAGILIGAIRENNWHYNSSMMAV